MGQIRDEKAAIDAMARVGPFRWSPGSADEWDRWDKRAQVVELIRAYEANVRTERLEQVLSRRGPGSAIPTSSMVERAEPRPCAACGRPIGPGQAYVVDGPLHVGCGVGR